MCAETRRRRARPRSGSNPGGMGRKPRISYPGAYFHVHTRGNNKGPAFVDTGDRLRFLRLLDRTTLKYGWIVYTFCLMTRW